MTGLRSKISARILRYVVALCAKIALRNIVGDCALLVAGCDAVCRALALNQCDLYPCFCSGRRFGTCIDGSGSRSGTAVAVAGNQSLAS